MEDLTSKTDEELEAIIRRAENTDVPGSLYQRAKVELELRDRKRMRHGPIGIHNTGENNNFIDNTFFRMGIGILDEGKNTKAKGNQFFARSEMTHPHHEQSKDLIGSEAPQKLKNLKWFFVDFRKKVGWPIFCMSVILVMLLGLFLLYWNQIHITDKPALSFTSLTREYKARSVSYPTWFDFWFDGNVKNSFPESRTVERIGWVVWRDEFLGVPYDYGYFSIDNSIIEFGEDNKRIPIILPITFEPNEAKHLGLSFEREVSDSESWAVYSASNPGENKASLLFEDANENIYDEQGRVIDNDVLDQWTLLPNNKIFFSSLLARSQLAWEILAWKIKRGLHFIH